MAWNYNSALTSKKDQVRFVLQDTDENRQLFQDEEIEWMLTQEMNQYMVVARLCDVLIGKARSVRAKKVGSLAITYNPEFYLHLKGMAMAKGLSYELPYAGGISVSDKQSQQQNSDWVQPSFARGIEDNPTAPQPDQPNPDNPLTNV